MDIENSYQPEEEMVSENTKEAKTQFIDQLMQAASEQDITSNQLGILAGTSMSNTARMKKANENITLRSMNQFAAVVGKKVRITLVPADTNNE